MTTFSLTKDQVFRVVTATSHDMRSQMDNQSIERNEKTLLSLYGIEYGEYLDWLNIKIKEFNNFQNNN